MCDHPVTRALRSGAFRFRGPIWSEKRRLALVSLGETLSDALTMAIRTEALSFQEKPDWYRGLSAMYWVFGLDRRHHLFRVEPIGWGVKFHESQFTKGFAHFLGVPERAARIGRTRALLKALGAAELISKGMSEVKVTAEALTSGNKRIDLLIEWKDSSGEPYAAAIEAKLGHHVASGQLPAYREHLQKKVPQERRLLIVVSPRLGADTRAALDRQRKGEWRWIAWRDLLIAHERALSGGYDDDAYRQFRRTLWEQAG